MHGLPLKLKNELNEYLEKNKVSKERRERLRGIVKELYKNTVYDSQEPVGVVAAQSLSEPTTQMSVDFGEKVILKCNGIIRIIKIGEFIDKAIGSLDKKDTDGWEVCDVSDKGLFVPGLNEKEKIEWKQVKEISRHKAPETMLEIKTMSGRKIIATDSHSFVVRKENKIVPVSGKILKTGDRIPSLLFLPENCLQQLETRPILKEQRFAKKPLPETLNLTRELGWIFGAYLAEGNCTPNFVSFSNTDGTFLSKIREFANTFGFSFNEYDNTRGFALSHDIRVNSKQLSRLLKKTCGTGSGNKHVPDFAYSANEDFAAGLISGYFDGDGNISVQRGMLRVSSKSPELINGIALLLTRFKIFATKPHGIREFNLTIPFKHAKQFKEKIGLNIRKKKERLDKLCEFPENIKDFIDMIGGFGDILYKVAKKLKYPTRYVNNFTNRQRVGRTTLFRYIKLFEKLAKEKNTDIEKELRILRRMFNSDVIWDKIISISKAKPSSEYVYDLSVPGLETFTTSEGIVTHNTMRTYHFAGTAGIQVTLGLPRMLEIFDARKEPRTPTMTVYLKPGLSKEQVKRTGENIKEVKIKDVVFSTVLDLTDLWIKCKLDLAKLKALDIGPEKLSKIVRLRNTNVALDGDTLTIKPKKADLRNLRRLKYSLLETHIKGIRGISQVVVTREETSSGHLEWVVNTLGSNLKKVFEIDGVDTSRTVCNNIFEVCDVLGIEAARNAVIKQVQYTMEEQGLGVDVRYIMLLADLMTVVGKIRAIGRYGIAGQKASVFVRAAFEETKKHLINAAIRGEKDPMKGTVENIMTNQIVPIGTGTFTLIGKIPEKGKRRKAAAKPKPAAAKPKPKPKPKKSPGKKKSKAGKKPGK